MTPSSQPYRISARDEERSSEEPLVDVFAARVIGSLGGAFHAVGIVGIVTSVWLAGFAATALLVRGVGASREAVGIAPWLTFGLSLLVTFLSHGARRVGDDVWRGHNLMRCRVACALVALVGPLGFLIGIAGIVALSRPRFSRLFAS